MQGYRDASSLVDDVSGASVCGASLLDDASAGLSEPVAAAPEPLISRTDTCAGNDSYPPSKTNAPDTTTHRNPPLGNIEDGIMFGNFSSGGNNSSKWKNQGSNNRHCKTLSRILSESNNVYFSSVITPAEMEEVTKVGEPPPLRATDSPLRSANDDGTSFSRVYYPQPNND